VENDGDRAGRDEERRRKERERRRRAERRKRREDDDSDPVGDALDAAETAGDVADGCSRLPGCGRGGGRGGRGDGCGSGGGSGGGRGGGGGCDGCDGPCDFTLLRLSSLLVLAAVLLPDRPAGRRLVRALVRGYQRRLTRFTPACPSTPNCSAYALTAVDSLGVRHGLVAAAARVRGCGAADRTGGPAPATSVGDRPRYARRLADERRV
jgi:putative component of membrane protein insertase Oxa1/YidC/SpoIIIJ protein YidD